MDDATGSPPPTTALEASAPAGTRRTAAVFDIDGVLADVRHRLHHVAARPKAWAAFFDAARDDAPLPEGLAAVATAATSGHVIVYLTGRPERCRADTLAWLREQGLPDGELFMRDDSDRRPARFTKVATLRRLSRSMEIVVFVDDDAAVVDSVRAAGFPVLHAQWMEPSTSGADSAPVLDAQEVLFEIQESEGRT